MDSIDESSTYDESDEVYISTKSIEDIRDISQIHPDVNTRDAKLKIRDHIFQTQSEWKIAEISVKSMGKCLHKLFKAVVNELNNNSLPKLG